MQGFQARGFPAIIGIPITLSYLLSAAGASPAGAAMQTLVSIFYT